MASEAAMSGCATCRGRGVLRADGVEFRCPDCGGGGHEAASVAGDPAKAVTGDRRRKAKSRRLNVPAKTWEAVREAAALNGREPQEWAADALANAARGQIQKHAKGRKGGGSKRAT